MTTYNPGDRVRIAWRGRWLVGTVAQRFASWIEGGARHYTYYLVSVDGSSSACYGPSEIQPWVDDRPL